jgi:MATE family multidrug resistance protein
VAEAATSPLRARPLWPGETRSLLRLGGPLIAAQVANIAIQTTDVVMVGWLGPQPLAANALALAAMAPLMFFGQGVMMAVAPMAAQAIGAHRRREARRAVRQGLWVGLALSALVIPLLLRMEDILRAIGQDPALTAGAGRYLSAAAFAYAPMILFAALRGFLSAHGESRIVLVATLLGVAVNALGNYALIFGNFGLPALGLLGAGISTVATHAAIFAAVLLHAVRARRYRRYALLARFHRADWPRFLTILRLGAPIGVLLAAETGLFAGAALLMGWLGAQALAAHAVALQLASITFMIPLGLSHATTVRVGLAHGGLDRPRAAAAAWSAMALTLGFMALAAAAFLLIPGPLVALFLDPTQAEAAAPSALAASFLAIAAVFQLVDGAQVSAAAALRGLGDTATPMAIALCGYWAIGLPSGWALAFPLGLEGAGVWWGLAVGLSAAAALLGWRLASLLRRAS